MAEILFTDMDGTLLLNDSTVSAEMKKTLDRFTAAGHRLVLSSGRALDSILRVMKQEGLFYPGALVIANNGSLIHDCDSGSSLWERRVPLDVAAKIIGAADRRGIHIHTFTEHEIVCRQEDTELRDYRLRSPLPVILTPDLLSVLPEPPYKLHTIHLSDKAALEGLKAEVETLCAGEITAQFSNDRYLEFFHPEAGKGNALRQVCAYLHIPVEESVAAGDAPNDISMLQAAGTGVAMANAASEVKAAAGFITRLDNDHNGLMEAIAAFFD